MAKQLDQLLVIDIESTCWEREPPRGQYSEIIEIGICLINTDLLEPHSPRSIMVRPTMSTIGTFCTQLTSITHDMVADAQPLSHAVGVLLSEYRTTERLFASWGDYDRSHFLKNCRSFGLKYPFGPTHLNIKNLFSIALGLPRELDLEAACLHVGLSMKGRHHRGIDDAWNTARLLCLLLKRMRHVPC